ncbi:hypothetical protein BB560_002961, partial [Smittium megazygosporum]
DKVNPPIGKSSKGAEDSLECIPLARRELLQNQHLLGHFGVKAMVDGLKQNGHSWENMYKDALAVAQKCIPCLKYNVSPKFYHSLKTITASEPFSHDNKKSWDIHIPLTMYCMNQKITDRHSISPLISMFGRNSNPLVECTNEIVNLETEDETEAHRLGIKYMS